MATRVATLFGELGLDAAPMQRGLRAADGALQGHVKTVELTEKQQQRLLAQSALIQQKLAAQTANMREKLAQQAAQFEARQSAISDRATNAAETRKQISSERTAAAKQRLAQQQAQFEARQTAIAERAEQSANTRRLAVIERTKVARERIAQSVAQFEIRQAERASNAIIVAQNRATAAAEAAQRRASAAAERAANSSRRAWERSWSGIREAASTAANYLSIAISAIGAASLKSASSLDDLQNKMTSATGSIGAANSKIAQFRRLDAPGVMAEFATETFAFLKPMKLSERVIENFTRSLGKIKLTDSGLDTSEFSRNMAQLFTQDFELQDLKQLVGRFPRAGELIAKQFNIKGSDIDSLKAGLQKLKAEGKLSLESFFSGFAEAVENDKTLSLLRDTVSIRMQKAFERISFAIAPLGQAILNVIEPAIPPLIAVIERLSEKFIALSPAIKSAIVGAGAFAAALAPVIAIGKIIYPIVAGIAGLIGAIELGPVAAGIAAVAAAAGALYLAWTSNFGGLRDFTLQAWEAIKSAADTALRAIYGAVYGIGGSIVSWWQENYPLIQQTVLTVSEAIKTTIQNTLSAIQTFWQKYGDGILAVVNTVWQTVKDVVGEVVSQISSAIKIALNVINGDWGAAWENFLNLLQSNVKGATKLIDGLVSFIQKAFNAMLPIVTDWGIKFVTNLVKWTEKAVKAVADIMINLPQYLIKLVPFLIKTGAQLGAAIWQGVKEGLASGTAGAGALPELPKFELPNLSDILFGTPQEQAAKAAKEAAENFSNAYAAAMEDKLKPAVAANTELTKEQLKAMKAQQKELEKQAKQLQENLATTRAAIFEATAAASNNPFVKLFEDGNVAARKMIESTKGLAPAIREAALAASSAQFGGSLFKQRIDNRLEALDLQRTAKTFKNAGGMRSFFDESGLSRIEWPWSNLTPEQKAERTNLNNSLRESVNAILNTPSRFKFNGKTEILDEGQRQKLINDSLVNLFRNVDPNQLDFGLARLAAKAFENKAVQKATEENIAEKYFSSMNNLITDKGLLVRGASINQTINAYGGASTEINGTPTRPSQNNTRSTRR